MTSLVDYQIEKLCIEKRLVEPYNPVQLNPASYDVLLGETVLIERPSVNGQRLWKEVDLTEKRYWLSPGEFVLGATEEKVNIPSCLECIFCLKSSRGREGYDHVLSAYIDPGFSGRITLEIHNSNRYNSLQLYHGLRIGQLRFSELSRTPLKAYDITGRYHGDMKPEPSRG